MSASSRGLWTEDNCLQQQDANRFLFLSSFFAVNEIIRNDLSSTNVHS